ncbi:PBP1A family penicillin-binding protein [Paenibacillus sp.]|uniref:transglycosylase domain-containing protein n=1 Tax=Paenibacillus sp. TaxID=58172 RepID=UPI002D2F9DCF|nr:PBP1A family penicillin-binding protein [Paenibacillus sp.]HZG87485.1 PBP1A family penicillin-binding protein [Paenibacillus sp.]
MKKNTRRLITWGLGAAALSAALLFLTAASYVTSLDVSKLGEPLAQPTVILDRDGEEIYRLSVRKFEPASIERMPDVLLQAIVAVEDRRYYEHPGVDVRSIARALYVDLRQGEYAEGASTITQQLAKTAFLTPDKSIERKLKEAAYALKIDMSYDKQEVLERYLNSIYFGEGAWGVQAASRTYFGKDVSELTLPEAALLAGLPKAPSRYSPVDNPEGALERRNITLRLMAEQGMITSEELEAALAAPLALHGVSVEAAERERQAAFASYIDAVLREAEERYGMTERELMAGGYVIATEMDRGVQEAAAAVYADPAMFPDAPNGAKAESGAAFVDQSTGGIRALIGSRERSDAYRAFNRATQLKRQPGSAFKPIAVYGPALEAGYTPNSFLYDGPVDFGGYRPANWDGGYRGVVTLAEAVRQSWNVPAVWLLDQIGVERGRAFAEKLGIALPDGDRNLSIALGGLSEGVSPLQMAQAFSAFAANGELRRSHAIREIATHDGEVVARHDGEAERVMDANHAYTLTLLLQHAVAEGTGRQGAVPGWPTAGKTGTTQLPDTAEFAGVDGVKDLWFAGYTPALTGAVWIGFDRTDREHYLTASSAAAAAVFREIMQRSLADETPTAFVPPPGYREEEKREEKEEKKEGRKEEKRGKKEWGSRGGDDDEREDEEKDDEWEEEKEERKERGKGKGKDREDD